jgi:hypothetical protein
MHTIGHFFVPWEDGSQLARDHALHIAHCIFNMHVHRNLHANVHKQQHAPQMRLLAVQEPQPKVTGPSHYFNQSTAKGRQQRTYAEAELD